MMGIRIRENDADPTRSGSKALKESFKKKEANRKKHLKPC